MCMCKCIHTHFLNLPSFMEATSLHLPQYLFNLWPWANFKPFLSSLNLLMCKVGITKVSLTGLLCSLSGIMWPVILGCEGRRGHQHPRSFREGLALCEWLQDSVGAKLGNWRRWSSCCFQASLVVTMGERINRHAPGKLWGESARKPNLLCLWNRFVPVRT